MSHARPLSILSLISPVLLVLLVAFVFSCSEQPTATSPDTGGGLEGSGKIDPNASASFLLGSVSDSVATPGRIEVWAVHVAFDDSTGIVSVDVVLANQTQRNLLPPIHFVITDIRPPDVSVVDFDGVSGDGPFYDFSAKLGDDNVLEPKERTAPVTMKFHTVTLRSFAIGFRIELGPSPGSGVISGVVYRDDNQNGVRDRCDRCEPGIPGITVALQQKSVNDRGVLLARTNANGEYRFPGLREGVYEVAVAVNGEEWKVTSTNPLLVMLIRGVDGRVRDYPGADFGLYPLGPVPPVPNNLFGPILMGPSMPFGTVLDSTFVNPPSALPVVDAYYLEVAEPPFARPVRGVVDSAGAWINGEKVFEYYRNAAPDTAYFPPHTIQIRDSLVVIGDNSIRLLTNGSPDAALVWRVYRQPMRMR
jgi:hypothetical protein